jgi:tetratricopeptide (TPR) repeat protein
VTITRANLAIAVAVVALLAGVILWRLAADDGSGAGPRAPSATSAAVDGGRERPRPGKTVAGKTPEPELPEPARKLRDEADEALRAGDAEAALAAAAECLEAAPGAALCEDARILGLLRARRFDQARPLVDACLEEDPANVACLGGRVTLSLEEGDLEAARAAAEELREADEQGWRADLADAQIAEEEGDHDVAWLHYQLACSAGQTFACRDAERNHPDKREPAP